MGLTPFEFKQIGVVGGPSAPIRVIWLRPFFPHDGTHPHAHFDEHPKRPNSVVERILFYSGGIVCFARDDS
ncbi:hypothetical protein Y032_0745g2002 [Ancylostoma ceylanicum]|uniref:Uncharacterized protein n=1 Tax=Ancylostoma ceylanicum TaxID=53326 RepID=A0A016WGF9_9BILA|nr:hypothetical protein Y032_0745g2002 [Ancylostoma ceylanicum]